MRRVKVLSIEKDVVVAELLTGEHVGKSLKIPLSRIGPTPTVGAILWHVEHNYWNIE